MRISPQALEATNKELSRRVHMQLSVLRTYEHRREGQQLRTGPLSGEEMLAMLMKERLIGEKTARYAICEPVPDHGTLTRLVHATQWTLEGVLTEELDGPERKQLAELTRDNSVLERLLQENYPAAYGDFKAWEEDPIAYRQALLGDKLAEYMGTTRISKSDAQNAPVFYPDDEVKRAKFGILKLLVAQGAVNEKTAVGRQLIKNAVTNPQSNVDQGKRVYNPYRSKGQSVNTALYELVGLADWEQRQVSGMSVKRCSASDGRGGPSNHRYYISEAGLNELAALELAAGKPQFKNKSVRSEGRV